MTQQILAALIPLLMLSACASAPPPRKVTVSERIDFDRAIGFELAEQMDSQLSFKKDPAVQAYLVRIAQTLADKNPELHLPVVKVLLLQDGSRRYRSYALPGGRIYLSSGMLKATHFESEIAAIMAIELGHLLKEDVLEYLRNNPSGLRVHDAAALPGVLPIKTLAAPEDIDFFGQDGMFSFSAKDNDEALAAAVGILYDAGYDPRGAISFFQYMMDNPSRSPWDPTETLRLLENARKHIALLTPLRNPIVQTDAFELIRPKLQKL